MSDSVKYSVVVPCYNSENSINELAFRIKKIFIEKIKESYEIIFVDDCSPNPNTWKTIEDLTQLNQEIRAFRLTRNFGKPGALMCGYQYSRGGYVIIMDDDLQHMPEDIPFLIEKKEHDIVMARFKRKRQNGISRFGSWLWNWLMYLLIDKPKNIYISPFNLVNRSVINALIKIKSPRPMIGALYLHITKDIIMVDVHHMQREFGKSGFTFIKRLSQFSNLVINNSSILLRAVAHFGILISVLSVIGTIWLILRWYIYGNILPGWTSLMVVVVFLGGLTLFSIGIIGEYLYRILNGLEGRPSFIVGKKIDKVSL